MTCKDCLHYGVCRFKDLVAPLSNSRICESDIIKQRCGDFMRKEKPEHENPSN